MSEESDALYGCGQCGTPVADEEYVTNWGSCAPCFDRHYDAYVKKDKRQRLVRKVVPWVLATVIATALFLGGAKLVGYFLYLCSQVN